TGSTPDGDAHPYVGALVVDGAVACSGVLVGPAVFATAAHCGVDGARVAVSLDPMLGGGWSLQEGTFVTDPRKGSDLAVVVLDAPMAVAAASLPAAGTAGSLAKGSLVTSVGYGYSSPGVYDGLRRTADSPLLKVGKATLTLSTAQGGPCMGDSGGPQLSGDTVLSLTSTGSKDCSGKAEAYRLDTASARAFLGGFVALP
ncbi:MAG: trypsin-like serine protease, partial [Gaiellaceae bacterium]